MRNPAGVECKYFYGNYYRGRHDEECRFIGKVQPPKNWSPDICKNCPVPEIISANGCTNLVLVGRIERRLIGKRHMVVSAFCTKSQKNVPEPRIGCGSCHPGNDLISE
jgi:hypothetical protein